MVYPGRSFLSERWEAGTLAVNLPVLCACVARLCIRHGSFPILASTKADHSRAFELIFCRHGFHTHQKKKILFTRLAPVRMGLSHGLR